MKILYISCHSILEYDELRILNDLGHDVLSIGAYIVPKFPHVSMRPPLNYDVDHNLIDLYHKHKLSKEFVDKFDCVIVMHLMSIIEENWNVLKNKTTILRTIGQNVENNEIQLQKYVKEGLKILRYSPKERELKNYAGESGLIRFLKYRSDFKPRNLEKKSVISFGQSIKQRGVHCGAEYIEKIATEVPFKLFGPHNESYSFFGGLLSYENQINELATNHCYFYTGTYPAQYTLNFIEAMLAGIPIIALGEEITYKLIDKFPLEVPSILDMFGGYHYNNINDISDQFKKLLDDTSLNDEISKKQIEIGTKLFSAENNKHEWDKFLNSI
jgi:hypothetical protein